MFKCLYLVLLLPLIVTCLRQQNSTCLSSNFDFNLELKQSEGVWFPVALSGNKTISNYIDCFNINVTNSTSNGFELVTNFTKHGNSTTDHVRMLNKNSFIDVNDTKKEHILTVLDSDYKNYLITLLCFSNQPEGSPLRNFVVIFTRRNNLDQDMLTKVQKIVQDKMKSNLVLTKFDKCIQ